MAQTQFITHAQITPPPTVVPRRGSGLFSAALIVLVVLVGAATGGLVLLSRDYKNKEKDSENSLVKLQGDFDVESIEKAHALEQRIRSAQELLNNHIYGSQVLIFLENNTLDSILFRGISYNSEMLRLQMVAPGYLAFAQQIIHYRKLGGEAISSISFSAPKLSESGEVEFGVDVKLGNKLLRSKPNTVIPAVLPPKNNTEEENKSDENAVESENGGERL